MSVCEGDEGSVGEAEGTGAHTVMTHGTPTLFPHKTYIIHVHIHTQTNTHSYSSCTCHCLELFQSFHVVSVFLFLPDKLHSDGVATTQYTQ